MKFQIETITALPLFIVILATQDTYQPFCKTNEQLEHPKRSPRIKENLNQKSNLLYLINQVQIPNSITNQFKIHHHINLSSKWLSNMANS